MFSINIDSATARSQPVIGLLLPQTTSLQNLTLHRASIPHPIIEVFRQVLICIENENQLFIGLRKASSSLVEQYGFMRDGF